MAAYQSGGYSMKEVGEHFGVHYSSVSKIIKKAADSQFKTWPLRFGFLHANSKPLIQLIQMLFQVVVESFKENPRAIIHCKHCGGPMAVIATQMSGRDKERFITSTGTTWEGSEILMM